MSIKCKGKKGLKGGNPFEALRDKMFSKKNGVTNASKKNGVTNASKKPSQWSYDKQVSLESAGMYLAIKMAGGIMVFIAMAFIVWGFYMCDSTPYTKDDGTSGNRIDKCYTGSYILFVIAFLLILGAMILTLLAYIYYPAAGAANIALSSFMSSSN